MRQIAIFELPFRGQCEFSRLLDKPGMRTVRVDPKDFARVFPEGAHLIIIPGSGKTTADLEYLRATGGEAIIRQHLTNARPLVGICGGYQMLGGTLHDPFLRQGRVSSIAGMGLLPVTTVFGPKMMSCDTEAKITISGALVRGEEHRSGTSFLSGRGGSVLHRNVKRCPRKACPKPQVVQAGHWDKVFWHPGSEHTDGLVSEDRKVWGTYLHRIFDNETFNELLFGHVDS